MTHTMDGMPSDRVNESAHYRTNGRFRVNAFEDERNKKKKKNGARVDMGGCGAPRRMTRKYRRKGQGKENGMFYRFRLLRATDENGGRRDVDTRLSREPVLVSNGRVRPQENRDGEKILYVFHSLSCVVLRAPCARSCFPRWPIPSTSGPTGSCRLPTTVLSNGRQNGVVLRQLCSGRDVVAYRKRYASALL